LEADSAAGETNEQATAAAVAAAAAATNPMAKACRFFLKGDCALGAACRFSHATPAIAANTPFGAATSIRIVGQQDTDVIGFPLWPANDGYRENQSEVPLAASAAPWSPAAAATSRSVFFVRGNCRAGDACPDLPEGNDTRATGAFAKRPLSCRFYNLGKCTREGCPFSHLEADSAAGSAAGETNEQATAAAIAAAATTPMAKACRFFLKGDCALGAACRFSHATPAIAANTPFGAATSIDTVGHLDTEVIGFTGRCRFGAGLSVLNVQCARSAAVSRPVRRVIVTGLSADVSDGHVSRMMSNLGDIVSIQRKHVSYAFVDFKSQDDAASAVAALNGSHVSLWNAAITANGSVGVQMAAELGGVVLHAAVKVLWYRPRGKGSKGAPGGKGSKGDPGGRQPKHVNDIATDGSDAVRSILEQYGPLLSFEKACPPSGKCSIADSSKQKALVKFAFAEDALRAVSALSKIDNVAALGGTKLFIEPVFTAKFTLLNAVYDILETEVNAIADATPSNVQIRTFRRDLTTVVRVSADDSKVLARMRIRFQRLFMGQRVLDSDGQVLWHDKFASKEAAEEFLRIGRAARCVILRDQRRNVLRLYGGTSASCVLAQSSVLSFIGSCELQRFTVPCPTAAWKPLLLQGLAAVKAATGASMVSLDIVKRGLMIEGDRNAAASVADFLASLARLHQMGHFARPHLGTICPVCCCTAGDDVEAGDLATVHLACSHTYCRSCFHHLLAQATDGDSSCGSKFPITCYADKCGQPISILDLKRNASASQFVTLLRASLDCYAIARIASFSSCPTPSCRNIHPAFTNASVESSGESTRVLYCGSCRTSVCMACETEDHEGLTCSQYRQESAPPNVILNRIHDEILTLKCPSCKKAFLDFEGCFALKCSNCPCGFCGWCLADCGSDAHSHVRKCPHKLNKDAYFGTEAEFKKAMRKKMSADLESFLIAIEPNQRSVIILALKDDLRDLGIDFSSSLECT
jgi:hypothetical protein